MDEVAGGEAWVSLHQIREPSHDRVRRAPTRRHT